MRELSKVSPVPIILQVSIFLCGRDRLLKFRTSYLSFRIFFWQVSFVPYDFEIKMWVRQYELTRVSDRYIVV